MLYIKELPEAGGRLIYSGRRESIRTKGEFFMRKYIVKRLLLSVVILFCVSFIIYTLMRCLPGSFVETRAMQLSQGAGAKSYDEWMEQLNASYGLDKPIVLGFLTWVGDALKGNFGDSWKYTVPVLDKFKEVIWLSFIMGAISFVLELIIAIPLGVIAATKQYSRADYLITAGALIGISLPTFFFATLLKLLFSVKLGWFPVSGADQGIKSLVLPSIALGFMHMASIARTTRSSMLETIRQDYIRTVRAKGLPEKEVITRHALRNALIPTTTVIGLQIGGMLGGSVLTESVFAWPGIGRYMIQSIQGRDIPSVMGCIIIFALSFAVINLIVDLIYGFIDPRIKAQYK